MLEIRDLEASYGFQQVLFGVDLDIGEGEAVALLGRNGMGKTTLVRSILGLVPDRTGTIRFDGKSLMEQPVHQVARAGIGLVPEGRQVFPNLSVRENLLATARPGQGAGRPWTVDAVLDLFPALAARLDAPGDRLSGGEQQMLAIGRALLTHPRLLILDEATEGIAPLIRKEIWSCLANLKARGQAILVIDKNIDALCALVDVLYILTKGRVAWRGTSAELLENVSIRARHLGV